MRELEFNEVEEYIRSHLECVDKVFKILGDVMDEWKEKCKKERDILADHAMLSMCALVVDPDWIKDAKKGFKQAVLKDIKELHFKDGLTGHANCERKFYNKYIKPVFKEN